MMLFLLKLLNRFQTTILLWVQLLLVFVDHSWQNDSVTYSANISTSSGLAIGTLYCTYDDNVATDKVQGSYYSAYYHYCHTKSEDNNSGFSSTVAPYETAYNSKISYAAGADVTVKGFSET